MSRFVCPVADKIGGNYTLCQEPPPELLRLSRYRSEAAERRPVAPSRIEPASPANSISGGRSPVNPQQIRSRMLSTFEHTDNDSAPHNFRMDKKKTEARPPQDLQIEALGALEQARAMPHGPARSEALKRAGILQNEADMQGLQFAKRGRPPKS